MEIYDAIHQRRSLKNFTPAPISPELLEKILETGIWAQNHGMTQPWHFTRVGPETREALAKAHEHSRAKILNPTEIVVVSNVIASNEDVRREDYAASACAIQNIALAAWSEGIALLWSSGKITRQAETYAVLGIDPEKEEIIGFLNLGYPSEIPAPPVRKPLSEVLTLLP